MIDNDYSLRLELRTDVSKFVEDATDCLIETEGVLIADFGGEEVQVGKLSLLQIKVGTITNEEEDVLSVTDGHSQEASDVACDLLTDDAREALTDIYDSYLLNLLLIEKIEVYEQYRNRGIGRKAVETLLHAYDYCEIIALKPFDFKLPKINSEDTPEQVKAKEADYRAATVRLTRYYQKMGFRLFLGEHMTYCSDLRKQPTVAEAKRLHGGKLPVN